jgi:foldase protein PrsA
MVLVIIGLAGCGGGGSRAVSSRAVSSRPGVAASVVSDVAVPAPGGLVQAGGVLVRVGGAAITRSAFDSRMRMEALGESFSDPIVPVAPAFSACIAQLAILANGPGSSAGHAVSRASLRARCAQLYERFRDRALDPLISGEWIIGGAAEEGIAVGDQEVRQSVRSSLIGSFATEAKLREYLAHTGENIPDMLFTAKVELLAEKIRRKLKASVPAMTSARIAGYYAAHLSRFAVNEQRDLGFVRTKSAAGARQIKKELDAGASFASIAKRLASEQPIYTTGGLLHGLEPGVFREKALNDAVFTAKPHVIGGPIRLNLYPGFHRRFHSNPADINNIDGYYIFEVQSIRRSYHKPLASVEAALKQELPTTLYRQALVAYIKAWRTKWRARTSCAPGYVVRKCREFRPVKSEAPEDPYTMD